MSTLPPHMERVQIELNDLKTKCEALDNYIKKGYPHSSEEEKPLHDQQLHHMNGYAKTLEARLKLYKKD